MSDGFIRAAESAVLMKIEATAGVDAAPTGANALRVIDYELSPLAGDVVERGYVQPKGGATEAIQSRVHRACKFSVELAGSGVAGTAPGFAAMLLAGSMAETAVEDVSVAYNPILRNQKTATLHHYVSGQRWTMLGAMGGLSIAIQQGQVPKLTWSGVGGWAKATTPVQPASAYADIVKGLVVSKINTPTCTLGGIPLILEKLDIDFGNEAKWHDLPNFSSANIANHIIKGQLTARYPRLASWDPEEVALAGNALIFRLVHGTAAGNIVEIDGGQVQLINPKNTVNSDGDWDLTAELRFLPSGAGDDDIIITFK